MRSGTNERRRRELNPNKRPIRVEERRPIRVELSVLGNAIIRRICQLDRAAPIPGICPRISWASLWALQDLNLRLPPCERENGRVLRRRPKRNRGMPSQEVSGRPLSFAALSSVRRRDVDPGWMGTPKRVLARAHACTEAHAVSSSRQRNGRPCRRRHGGYLSRSGRAAFVVVVQPADLRDLDDPA